MNTWLAIAFALTLPWTQPALALEPPPMSDAPASPTTAARPDAGHRKNRLSRETSPYLLQHQTNPVDWFPWGEEAFAKAAKEGKPVFLSVGYSSCHWCHVMERESFEDEEIARFLNERFVSIKVDREERPDVDDVYMRVTQMLTGHGGWPMSVFLTPERKPFFAGTYFPKEPRFGMVSFLDLLRKLDEAWRKRRGEVEESASELAKAAADAGGGTSERTHGALTPALLERAVRGLARRFDPTDGGFGGAPKFPPHQALRLILEERERAGAPALDMARVTLDRMAAGGIHDHVGGGFHRYSVDETWHVPHFEKMLYDNATLARAYVEAFAVTKEGRHLAVAEGIFAFLERELRDPAGGFHSALDADSEGVEGKFYVFTPSETAKVLGERAAAFDAAYDVTRAGNWEHGVSILRLTRSQADPAAFAKERALLLEARAARVRPGLDDKVLTSWNALAIGALARAYAVTKDARWKAMAERAADFLAKAMRDERGRLLRTYRAGTAAIPAFLEDHAFLADALLDLHEATGDAKRLEAARSLCDELLARFEDREGGGFFSTAHDAEPLLFRPKEPFDGALPNDGAVAVRALVRLHARTGDARYLAAADRAFRAYGGALERSSAATLTLLGALCLRGEVPTAPVEAGPVSATARLEGSLRGGGVGGTGGEGGFPASVLVRVAIRAPLHVSAPLASVTLESDLPLEQGPPAESAPREKRFPYDDAPARVHEGAFEVRVPVRLAAGAALPAGAKGRLRAVLRYRACDDRQCFPEASIAVDIQVEVP